jgi:predicted CXXCH cytochrome family protein
VPQPIAFNHAKHTEQLGLNCEFCHKYVSSGAHAGLPDASTCSMCHSTPQGTSEEAARVTELLEAGDPIRFNKLFRLPDHVFYTHRRHAGIGELECESCHGGIASTERPPKRALVEITMGFCMDCHRERGETNECTACHR